MTATLPDGMEYKNLTAACIDAAAGVWGSEHPEEDGVRNLIVAVTGVRDEVGDIIVPGAFEHTLQRLEPKGCMGHDWNRVTGYPEAIEEVMPGDPRLPKTDRFGKPWPAEAGALFVRHRYHTDTDDGQRAYKDAKFLGPRLACSIGYVDPKDDNGKPLYSYKQIDPVSGKMTRYLPRLDLFEYSQVLHGAHLLAGGVKDGRPTRLERKARTRPDMELKATVKLVRDSAYWRLPVGTPIRLGMKPQGPKAQRIASAGQQPDENAGVVEVDATNLRIKPTAKGKQKGQVAIGDAYSGIISLIDRLGEHTGEDSEPLTPFNSTGFLTEDTQKINEGEPYNPLDILVANAIPPAEVEEDLRNADWDTDRLGDAADRQDEIDSYIADVADAYREKYNAELVRQNDTGVDDIAEPSAGGTEPDTRPVNEQEEDRRYQAAADRAAQIPTQQQQRAQSEANRAASQRGEMPLRPGAPAPAASAASSDSARTRISAEDQAEITRLKQNGRDNEAAKLYREAVQRARTAEGITPEQISPTRARLRQEQVSGTAPAPSLEDGRTMQAAEPQNGEAQAFELTGENGAQLRVYSLKRPADPKRPWTFDIVTADGETIEGESTFRSPGSALVRAEGEFHEAERGDTSAAAEQDRLVPAAAEEPVSMPSGFDGTGKPQSGYAIPPPPADDAVVRESDDATTEDIPEAPSGESIVEPGLAPEQAAEPGVSTSPTDADITRMVIAKPDAAAAQAAQMTDDELAAYNAAMSDRAVALGKPGQRTPGHQAIADELARRAEAGPQEDAVGEPLGETGPALTEEAPPEPTETIGADELADAGITPEGEALTPAEDLAAPEEATGETITSDEIADTEEAVDTSFGVTEAPDGEFEVDNDIADRQDRVASLLTQADAGSLDLSGSSDDQLRGTRADIVDELRLQQHLERRRSGERGITRQQTDAADIPEPGVITDDEAPAAAEDTGPKPRPGVAGAAEDLADALDNGDDDQIDAATDRFRKALSRSRSDSPVVAELRAMLAPETGGWDADALRDAAQRLRDEQRAKRNEGARRRRTARRFERERLRSLLGQVEAEMRTRNLDYDPVPDVNEDADSAVTLDTTPAVAWSTETRAPDWANTSTRVDSLAGSGYTATVSTYVKPNGALEPSKYQWTVTDDNGAVLATGSGTATDPDSARASIEIALDTQRKLGLIPIDAQIPQGSVPEHTSATPLADVVESIGVMRDRIEGGRRLNPITGQPDPFADALTPLPVPERSRFADADQVRKYLEANGVTTRSGAGESRNVADTYRWDTAKLTPGGAFAVVDNLQGQPQVVHTVSGATFPPPSIGKSGLGRADLLRYATIAESTPDVDGNLVNWNQGGRDLGNDIMRRTFIAGENGAGSKDLRTAVLDRLTREKVAAGQFTHALVQRDITFVDGVTNESRKQYVQDQHRALGQLVNVTRGKPNTFDKKTLDAANGARTLAAMGAPDAAAALLTRRAAEVREQYDTDAPSHGSAVLDALATGYLGMFSPMRSHGERVASMKPGERLFLAERGEGEPQLRSFRALAAPRRDPRGAPSDYITPVIDEKTGEQKFLHTSISQFRIEDTEDYRFGHNPLGGARSHGDYAVVGPGEEPPATAEDLATRAFDDAAAIPQDVLDAAAEALPESARETAVRRATPSEGVRPPRRRSPAAPRRTARPMAAPEPVAGEQHLAQAQGRIDSAFLGMPFSYGDKPERGSFADLAAVREHLVALESGSGDPRVASSARAVLTDLDSVKLSPGGVFLVRKDGTVTHVSSSQRVWPPSPNSKPVFDEYVAAGALANQASGLRVARALESGVFDGEQVDWSGDGMKAVKQIGVIARRNGKFHPLMTAQRAAYRDGVLDSPKPTKTDIAMFTGIANNGADLEGPNPEAFDRSALLARKAEYSNSGGYAADSKKGVGLVDRINAELRLVEPLAKTAPLDAVRRLTRLADELDGETITMRIEPSFSQRMAVHGAKPDAVKTLTPSEDLRAAAKMITDVYDPDKISESGRFRQAGMVGQVELTSPKITMGRTWEDPNGVAARRLESDIKASGGLRFYRDENGLLHATFNNSADVPIDITEGNFSANGGQVGAITLAPDGRLTLSYMSANRLIIIEGRPGSWKFTPEQSGGGDTGGDISGPEIDSAQVSDSEPVDTGGDITPGVATAAEVEQKIRQVYDELATEPQDWVRIARIRARLDGIGRAEQDKALLQMMSTGFVHLAPESNTKVLTPEDREGALRVGSEDLHLIAIEPPE